MIKTFIVDDEAPAIAMLRHLLQPYAQIEIGGAFTDPRKALAAALRDEPHLIFLDIDMPQLKGIEAAIQLQEKLPGLTIIFVTAYRDYALDAFKSYPLDYILKPVDEARFRQTMDRVFEKLSDGHSILAAPGQVKIRCFGRFEITVGPAETRPLKLGRGRMREVLAYLLHNFNRSISRRELLGQFFNGVENSKTVNHLHVLISRLRSLLESAGISREQITIGNTFAVSAAPGVCDYIDFIRLAEVKQPLDEAGAAVAEEALKSCHGPYLEGEDYLWVIEERQWVENLHEELSLKLFRYYHDAGLAGPAEQTLMRLLDHNNLSGAAWQALLQLYLDGGASGLFARNKFQGAYERYRQILAREFGSLPEERFQAHYRRLLGE